MQTYTCKCGKSKIYGDSPVNCERCSICGSGYHNIKNIDQITEPAPHVFEVRYDASTGKSYKECIHCYKRIT